MANVWQCLLWKCGITGCSSSAKHQRRHRASDTDVADENDWTIGGQRCLARIVTNDQPVTLPQITAQFNARASGSVSILAVQRSLWSIGFRTPRLSRVSLFNARHKALGLQWAREHRHWSDNSRLQLYPMMDVSACNQNLTRRWTQHANKGQSRVAMALLWCRVFSADTLYDPSAICRPL